MNVVDCTLGDAGHAEKILESTGPNGMLLGIDADVEAILRAKQYLYKFDLICRNLHLSGTEDFVFAVLAKHRT